MKQRLLIAGVAVALLAVFVFAVSRRGDGASPSHPSLAGHATAAAADVPSIPQVTLATTASVATTTSLAPPPTVAKPRAVVPVTLPPPASVVDAAHLLQNLNALMAQAAQATTMPPQTITRAQVQAALDGQLRQLGIKP
ncbi:MAG: hypothetical protein M3N98_01720 [Actinomycetota bacterium]|nr:hypothetical protein [Actinomycetota bacterium]